VMSESFAASGPEMTLEKLIATANWQFASGVTELLPMSFHYFQEFVPYKGRSKSFREDRFFDDPSFYATYLGRLKMMLSGGQHVADVALLVPETSIWANYAPTGIGLSFKEYRKKNPVASQIDDDFIALSRELLQNQIDFDYLDDEAFQMAEIDNGKLRLAKETYSILVLPSSTTIRWTVAEKILEFWRSGGIVIAFGRLPNEAAEWGKDEAVRAIMAQMFETRSAASERKVSPIHVSKVEEVVEAIRRLWKVDLRLSRPDPNVQYIHKRKNGYDIYFLVNNEDAPKNLDVTFRCSGVPQIWNPRTGEITDMRSLPSSEGTRLSVSLEKLSGVFIVFGR